MADEEYEGSPFTRPGFLISAAAVVALLVMLVWLLVRPGGDDEAEATTTPEETTSETATESPTETPSTGGDASEASWCGLEAVELEGTLTRAPADIEWEYAGTIAVPALEGHGPGVIEDSGLRHCWAQTPEGAVLAATSMIASTSSPDLLPEVYQELVVDGELRDSVLADPEGATSTDGGAGRRATMVGFRLLSYAADEASVDVLISTNTSEDYTSLVIPLLWVDGEWKVNWQSEDEFLSGGAVVSSTSGYVLWGQP